MKHKPRSRFASTHAHCQAAAAARIEGKDDVITAAKNGNIELVKDHVVADASCVLKADSEYACPFRARAAAAHDVSNPVHRCSSVQDF
jgi:hypothetical protein